MERHRAASGGSKIAAEIAAVGTAASPTTVTPPSSLTQTLWSASCVRPSPGSTLTRLDSQPRRRRKPKSRPPDGRCASPIPRTDRTASYDSGQRPMGRPIPLSQRTPSRNGSPLRQPWSLAPATPARRSLQARRIRSAGGSGRDRSSPGHPPWVVWGWPALGGCSGCVAWPSLWPTDDNGRSGGVVTPGTAVLEVYAIGRRLRRPRKFTPDRAPGRPVRIPSRRRRP